MKRVSLVQTLVGASIALVLTASAASAANCGGGIPCSCGNLVTANHTLSSVDPIVGAVCPANGLEVNPGVLLDLGENTIRGSGGGDGIVLHAGLGGGTVHNGTVREFINGIQGFLIVGRTLTALTVAFNAEFGILLQGVPAAAPEATTT